LRGTPFDPFGHSAERRMERRLLAEYEADLDLIAARIGTALPGDLLALASVPAMIRGYGPVKRASADRAAGEREAILGRIREGSGPDRLRQAAE
jgi:indolepyruvate ferredoxin oxidoreductase